MKGGIGLLFHMGGFPVKAAGIYSQDTGLYLEGTMELTRNSDFGSMVEQLLKEMGISAALDIIPPITAAQLWITWTQKRQTTGIGIRFQEAEKELGSVQVMCHSREKKTEIKFVCCKMYSLSEIPMAGDLLGDYADSGIGSVQVCFDTEGNGSLAADIVIKKEKIRLVIPLGMTEKNHNMVYSEQSGSIHWKNWKKNLGCVTILALGAAFTEGCLYLMIQAECKMGILTVSLEGLGICIPFTDLSHIKPMLTGLGLSIKNDFMEISGSFAKELNKPSYIGKLVIRIKTFSFSLMGGYEQLDDYTSVFAVGIVGVKLGNPCITITGIAAGFGYNRALQIPKIDRLGEFALMKVMRGEMTPSGAAQEMPARQNCHWAAAGVKFVSYEMIKGEAVVSVQFGKKVQADITGKAVMDFSVGNKALLAHVVLLIKATFQPEQGLLALQAQMGGESYLLSKDCRITGGFAFYLWYEGEHKGDFVVSLGGYHRAYKKPGHYPNVAPLGLTWKITDELLLQGTVYFAVTPSCLMAGGAFQMLFDAGWVRAWCTAQMDVMIRWKPFFYDFYISISLGISVKIIFKRVKLEIGCDLHLWGPDFSGIAKIKLWIISFTIEFIKSSADSNKTIDWKTFVQTYLPLKQTNVVQGETFSCCRIQIAAGMLSEEAANHFLVRSDGLEVMLVTQMPLTSYQINQQEKKAAAYPLGIYPCGIETLESCLSVTLTGNVNEQMLEWKPIIEQVPCALWGNKQYQDHAGNWKQETAAACTGLHMRVKKLEYSTTEVSVIRQMNETDQGEPIVVPVIAGKSYVQETVYGEMMKAGSGPVADKRSKILNTLGIKDKIILGSMWSAQETLEELFRETPLLQTLGSKESSVF